MKKQTRKQKILNLARQNPKLHGGELELDSNAEISEGDDNGAYVQTWMWVPFEVAPQKILNLARQDPKLRDGELELDSNAEVSEGDDNGAYVQTWMWVSFEGTKLDKDKA